MSVPDLQKFIDNLVRSKLLTAVEVENCRHQAYAETPAAALAQGFAEWLVQKGKLTAFQAEQLQRGHARFILDEYRLLERIGSGRMAGVYRAVHRRGMPVAIKILPPSRAKLDTALARFEREAEIALKLDHPSIVKTFHAGSSDGLHYIAMELLDGETLEDHVKTSGKMHPDEVIRLATQMLGGMQHMYERNLVHRDLKPGNVMLLGGSERRVKILDVGLGRELFDEGDASEGGTALTAAGELIGSPDYTSPEQSQSSHAADIRSDLYSLGCVLYECLTGHVPFPEKKITQKFAKHAKEMPAAPNLDGFAHAEAFKDWLWKLLAKKPSDRFQTPREAELALKSIATPKSAEPDSVQSWLSPSKVFIAVGTIGLLACLAFAFHLGSERMSPGVVSDKLAESVKKQPHSPTVEYKAKDTTPRVEPVVPPPKVVPPLEPSPPVTPPVEPSPMAPNETKLNLPPRTKSPNPEQASDALPQTSVTNVLQPAWTVGTAEQMELDTLKPKGHSNSAAVVRRESRPEIDGSFLDWVGVPVQSGFILPALENTRRAEVRFSYDELGLYVAAHVLDDSPLVSGNWPADTPLPPGDSLRIAIHVGTPTIITLSRENTANTLSIRAHDVSGAPLALPTSAVRSAFKIDPDNLGYKVEAILPWTLVRGSAESAPASLAWEVRWGDAKGKFNTLLYQDGLTRSLGAGFNALADPSFWGPLRWLTPQQGRTEATPPKFDLPVLNYTLDENAFVTLVIENADGTRIRNLIAEAPRLKGDRREVWDGRDEQNKVVPPGIYRWRGLKHTGIRNQYLMSYNNPAKIPYRIDDTSGWGSDHDPPVKVVTNKDHIYLAWANCEGGASLLKMDDNTNKKWGWRSDPSIAMGTNGLAVDDRYVYVLKSGIGGSRSTEVNSAQLVRFNTNDGRTANWPKENGGFGQGVLMVRDRAEDKEAREKPMAIGLSLHQGVLYISLTRINLVEMRDAGTGKVVGSLKVESPGESVFDSVGRLLIISGSRILRIDLETKSQQEIATLQTPRALALSPGGTIFVADEAAHQIVVLSPEGKELRRIGKAGGRPHFGYWQKDAMYRPYGIHVDARDRLWVAEMDGNPKRFSVWEAATGKFIKDYIGPPSYGSSGSFIDSDDPTIAYSNMTKFRLDFKNNTYEPLVQMGRRGPTPDAHFGWSGQGNFYKIKSRRYFVNESAPLVMLAEPDRYRPAAAIGEAKDLPKEFKGNANRDDWYS